MKLPAGDTDYESADVGYEHYRRADPRIAAALHAQLGTARSVINVGAGAGSYEPDDRHTIAVEPSAAMRARRTKVGAVPAINATADELPFDDAAIDAAMAVFTVHQWPNLSHGLTELRRVTRGPVAVLTIDPAALEDFWLSHYLPERAEAVRRRFPSIDAIRSAIGGLTTVRPVPIPRDCTDGFVEAYYGRPEALLAPEVRAAQSGWQFIHPDAVTASLEHLADDLSSGDWDSRFGHLRSQTTLTGPLTLVTAYPGP